MELVRCCPTGHRNHGTAFVSFTVHLVLVTSSNSPFLPIQSVLPLLRAMDFPPELFLHLFHLLRQHSLFKTLSQFTCCSRNFRLLSLPVLLHSLSPLQGKLVLSHEFPLELKKWKWLFEKLGEENNMGMLVKRLGLEQAGRLDCADVVEKALETCRFVRELQVYSKDLEKSSGKLEKLEELKVLRLTVPLCESRRVIGVVGCLTEQLERLEVHLDMGSVKDLIEDEICVVWEGLGRKLEEEGWEQVGSSDRAVLVGSGTWVRRRPNRR